MNFDREIRNIFENAGVKITKSILNEISDELKKSFLEKRQAQLNKAKTSIKNFDLRQINKLPTETDYENASNALSALKSKMKKYFSVNDSRMRKENNTIVFSVRDWGNWISDNEDDYDWANLDERDRELLDDILISVQKSYGVQIHEEKGEKHWLSFEINFKQDKKSTLSSKKLIDFILEINKNLKQIFIKNGLNKDDIDIDIGNSGKTNAVSEITIHTKGNKENTESFINPKSSLYKKDLKNDIDNLCKKYSIKWDIYKGNIHISIYKNSIS